MALETYASGKQDEIHTDVLLKARQACYKARDAFYSCLEKQSDKKPTEIGSVGLLYPTECKGSREEFVKHCRASWVKHFDRQYCMTKRTQRLLDDRETRRGPLLLPQPHTFKPPTSP
ncbi:hypothetical protein QUC31_020721 [Theobroma cacao]|uniref:Cytochrome c oxidase assembly factor 6 n=2 Tax=Theobroma cacao TaxID=3641 RepID=A0AB32UNP0_THECC|nr:PREDICTED: cytochrome c oxidase assembly factor 6 [Theobroma cacao]EOY29576.1 Cytochrome c oxidase, subunit Vib family protein isoform 1 [Theobroma cacao]